MVIGRFSWKVFGHQSSICFQSPNSCILQCHREVKNQGFYDKSLATIMETCGPARKAIKKYLKHLHHIRINVYSLHPTSSLVLALLWSTTQPGRPGLSLLLCICKYIAPASTSASSSGGSSSTLPQDATVTLQGHWLRDGWNTGCNRSLSWVSKGPPQRGISPLLLWCLPLSTKECWSINCIKQTAVRELAWNYLVSCLFLF